MSNVLTSLTLKAALAALIEPADDNPAGPLWGVKIGLFTAVSGSLGPQTTIADLTVATFDGYTPSSAITWSGPLLLSAGDWAVVGPSHAFIATGGTVSEVVIGYYLFFDATPDVLRYAEMLPSPDPIVRAGDSVTVVPIFKLPADGDYGAGLVQD